MEYWSTGSRGIRSEVGPQGASFPRALLSWLCIAAGLLTMGAAADAAAPATTTVEYHGLRPTDPGGRDGLRNPERGFRTEACLAQVPGAWVFTPFELPLETDPRRWQPTAPGDTNFTPLTHAIAFHGSLPDLPPGGCSLALWLPDPAPTLRMNPAYAIRLANRDTVWWRSLDGRRGANVFGLLQVE